MKIFLKTLTLFSLTLVAVEAADPSVISPLKDQYLSEYFKQSEVKLGAVFEPTSNGATLSYTAHSKRVGKGELLFIGDYLGQKKRNTDVGLNNVVHTYGRDLFNQSVGYAFSTKASTFSGLIGFKYERYDSNYFYPAFPHQYTEVNTKSFGYSLLLNMSQELPSKRFLTVNGSLFADVPQGNYISTQPSWLDNKVGIIHYWEYDKDRSLKINFSTGLGKYLKSPLETPFLLLHTLNWQLQSEQLSGEPSQEFVKQYLSDSRFDLVEYDTYKTVDQSWSIETQLINTHPMEYLVQPLFKSTHKGYQNMQHMKHRIKLEQGYRQQKGNKKVHLDTVNSDTIFNIEYKQYPVIIALETHEMFTFLNNIYVGAGGVIQGTFRKEISELLLVGYIKSGIRGRIRDSFLLDIHGKLSGESVSFGSDSAYHSNGPLSFSMSLNYLF